MDVTINYFIDKVISFERQAFFLVTVLLGHQCWNITGGLYKPAWLDNLQVFGYFIVLHSTLEPLATVRIKWDKRLVVELSSCFIFSLPWHYPANIHYSSSSRPRHVTKLFQVTFYFVFFVCISLYPPLNRVRLYQNSIRVDLLTHCVRSVYSCIRGPETNKKSPKPQEIISKIG